MDVHRAVLPGVLVAPDLVQQLLPAVHPVGVLHQKLQEVKFAGGQLHGLVVFPGGAGVRVDGEAPAGEALVLLLLALRGGGAAEQGLDPGLDL